MTALALGAFLRFYNLGALEMSPDEGASWGAASAPNLFEVIVRQAVLNPGKLPIHDLMLHGWIALFGSSMVAMRAMSALLGTVSILLVYFTAREIFLSGDSRDAIADDQAGAARTASTIAAMSALLFAVNVVTIKYSREARMYPVMLAAAIAQVGLFARTLRCGGAIGYGALAVLTALAIGANFSALLVPATEGFLLLYFIGRAGWNPSDARAARGWTVAAALAAGGLVLAPTLFTSFGATTAGTAGGIIRWIKRPALYAPFALFNKGTGSFAFPVFAMLAAWGAIRGWMRGAHDPIAFAMLWMWAPPIIMVVASYTLTPVFVERYALSCFVPFFILVALGVFELSDVRLQAVALGLAVAFSLGHLRSYDRKSHDAQYREAVAAADAALKPGEAMTVVPAYAVEVLRYYLPAERRDRAVRVDSGSSNIAVLIFSEQHMPPSAAAKYTNEYPRVIARVRGAIILGKQAR